MIDYRRIIDRISPGKDEKAMYDMVAKEAMKRTEKFLGTEGISAVPVPVGSASRDTNLSHSLRNSDVDIFVVFPRDLPRNELRRMGLRTGHAVLPEGVEKYAEHPYVSGFIQGVKVDVVPCYSMKEGEEKISAVDRTVLHNEYLKGVLNSSLRGEIRLLKAFLITAGIYGSEVSKSGFSGLVTELLVLRTGSFENAIRVIAGGKGRISIPDSVELKKKFPDPIVVPDPVDPDRNAAAGISEENLSRLRIAGKLYLRSPSDDFFIPATKKPAKRGGSHDRGTAFRLVIIPKPDEVDDVVYPQANRFRKIMISILEGSGFIPVSSAIFLQDSILILIECERPSLPGVEKHHGPPADSDNALDFIDKWSSSPKTMRGPYVEGNRLVVEKEREVTDIETAILSGIAGTSIGKHLDELKDRIRIIDPVRSGKYGEIMESYLSRGIMDS